METRRGLIIRSRQCEMKKNERRARKEALFWGIIEKEQKQTKCMRRHLPALVFDVSTSQLKLVVVEQVTGVYKVSVSSMPNVTGQYCTCWEMSMCESQRSVNFASVLSHHPLLLFLFEDMARFFANQPHITRHASTPSFTGKNDHPERIIYY